MFQSLFQTYPTSCHLLLDEKTVSHISGCRQEFHQAVKDPANPIIRPTERWEGNGCSTWGGTVLYDKDTNCFRMYYSTFEDGGTHKTSYYRGGMMESADGLNWIKPALFHTVYENMPCAYSCRLEGDPVGPRSFEAVYDPRPECPPEERYKALYCRRFIGGIHVSCSADGITWRHWSKEPVWYACSDIIHPFWDEYKKTFVCYFKLWKLYAEEKDDKAPGGFTPMTALTPGGIQTEERPDGTTAISGRFVVLHPDSKAEIIEKTFIVRSGKLGADDGGGSHLSGAWYMRRVIHWAESSDFIHWEHEQEALDTDELDRPTSNIQRAEVFQMGGYYLAFLNVHDERGHFDQQFSFSSDGIHWKRPWRGNILSYGAPGQFDAGMVGGMLPPILTQTQMIFYYGGYGGGHAEASTTIGIGRAAMRRDGFACWKATGAEPGVLETVLLPKQENRLLVNIDSEAGWLTAALLDEEGHVIPGYDHTDCESIRADSASWPDCCVPVVWSGKNELPDRKELRVQLRFCNTSVYSVRI